jgi:hypothetical protein
MSNAAEIVVNRARLMVPSLFLQKLRFVVRKSTGQNRASPAPSAVDSTLVGLRDRALIGVMTYAFARIGAVVSMRIILPTASAGGSASTKKATNVTRCRPITSSKHSSTSTYRRRRTESPRHARKCPAHGRSRKPAHDEALRPHRR